MILNFAFVYCNDATVAVNIKNYVIICTINVVMSWCIRREKDKCTVNMNTTYDVTERSYGLAYLRVCESGK